ncbi:MAG: Hsp20/alpha crystallin family protein [Thermodesulfovibrionales bacterium]
MSWSELERWGRFPDPWREFERLNRAFLRPSQEMSVDFPAMNVWVSGDSAVVTTELPGVDSGGLEISVVGKTLTVRGSRSPEELKGGESYHRRERWHGQFSKTIEIPFTIEADKVEAQFSKGILSISLPRAEADKPRSIAIKAE